MPRHVRLHIDELVLHGFAPADRYRIADALQAHLTALLTDQALAPPAARVTLARVDAGTIHLRAGWQPATVGEQLAGALHGGLSRWPSR